MVFSVALFMVLPYLLASLLHRVGAAETVVTIAEAAVRILLFLLYMLLISKMEDIQRVFMYHGAEHKCINCVEHGMPLTVDNVMKSSRFHQKMRNQLSVLCDYCQYYLLYRIFCSGTGKDHVAKSCDSNFTGSGYRRNFL